MRRLLVASAIAIGTLAVSSTASASPQFKSSYKLKLTTTKPGASSGWTATAAFSDPGDPMRRPKILTGVRITFPKGSQFDTKGRALCRLSQQALDAQGPEAACPSGSKYGSGKAAVIVGATALSFPVLSWNLVPLDFGIKKPELFLSVVIDPNNPALAFYIEGELGRNSVFFSLELAPENDIHTTLIRYGLPAAHRGRHAYFRTPKRCPTSGHWTAKVSTTFADNSKESRSVKLRCKRH
jgi:hypothetical protein